MAQPNFESLDPTDTPRAVPTALQASSVTPSVPNVLIARWQPRTTNPVSHLTEHILYSYTSASQNNKIGLCNCLALPYPYDPGDHVLKRVATEVGRQGFSVKWFKFIHPSPKPRMTETTVSKTCACDIFTHFLHELSMDHQPP